MTDAATRALWARINALEEENERLRQIADSGKVPDFDEPAWKSFFGQSGAMVRIVHALYSSSGTVGHERLRWIAGQDLDPIAEGSLKVFITRARKVCKDFGLEIHNIRSVGYFMPNTTKVRLAELLEKEAA